MTISICMIVKNEERVLKRCLDSCADLADEIIIVDTGSTDKTDENLGTMRSGYYKPWMDNAFVNFRPNNAARNSVARIYGAGQGHAYAHQSDADRDAMQDRSYVLIDAPENTKYVNTEVFGAGDYSGVGMRNTSNIQYVPDLTPAIARDNADGVTASTVIDLMRGHLKDVYGASYKEGITRRTIVNVPTGSTIHLNRIFGGAYGLVSIDKNSQPDYREKLNEELRQMRESEMWQAGATVRQLRPENN